jgi:hypothetical protein
MRLRCLQTPQNSRSATPDRARRSISPNHRTQAGRATAARPNNRRAHQLRAVLLTVGCDGTLLERRGVEFVDAGVPGQPHYHEGQPSSRRSTSSSACASRRTGTRGSV